MDDRIEKLEVDAERTEHRLSVLELDVAVIKSNHAAKADFAGVKAAIAEAKGSIIVWGVSAAFLAQLLPLLLKKSGL